MEDSKGAIAQRAAEIRIPKSEFRNKSEIRIPNAQDRQRPHVSNIAFLDLEFVSDFGFRISEFSGRHQLWVGGSPESPTGQVVEGSPSFLTHFDSLERRENGVRVRSVPEMGEVLRLFSKPSQSGQQMQVGRGVGGGHGQEKDELHRQCPFRSPNHGLVSAANSELEMLDSFEACVRKGQATVERRAGEHFVVESRMIKGQNVRHAAGSLQSLAQFADDPRWVLLAQLRKYQSWLGIIRKGSHSHISADDIKRRHL
jgi:hypothetical protein